MYVKQKFTLNDKVLCNTTKLNTNVTIEYYPSYDVAKVNAMDNGSTITPDFPIAPNSSYNIHTKMPCYRQHYGPGGSDVPITINPLMMFILNHIVKQVNMIMTMYNIMRLFSILI